MSDDAGWLGALLAVTLIGWALQPGEQPAKAHVPVRDVTAFQNEVSAEQVDLPLPPGTVPQGRITRLTGSHGALTNGRFTCPLPPAEAVAFFRGQLPGRIEVSQRELAGGQATIHQTAADRRTTIHIAPARDGSELFVVIREY